MQKVAAYVLERRDNLAWNEVRTQEVATIKAKIDAWLRSKGRKTDEATGTYDAEDGSHATFSIEEAVDGERSWWMVQLDEITEDGRLFRASVSVTNRDHAVTVYLTMEVGSAATLINHVEADPKCPKLVRSLLELPGRWYHGASQLHQLRRITGFEGGEGLVAEITDPERTLPVVVVSTEKDRLVLPHLDERLAYDLAGLANVVVFDADATWALTDHLGKSLSCYEGAVRLYWPRFKRADDPFRHPLWTAQRLRAAGDDLKATHDRFRRQLRSLVMRASALSVVRPRDIDNIRNAAARRAFADMKARANSLADFQELADSYAKDNDKLRVDNKALYEKLEKHEETIADLQLRLQNAEIQLRHREAPDDEISPDAERVAPEDESPPSAGEVRFYKKRFAAPKHDVMVRAGECGCDNWENAHAADKAKKGIAKLEGGRSHWSSIQHCASCTGGGMWKVRW